MTPSPWLSEARRLLADGEWHPWLEIKIQLVPLVPLAQANSASELNRRRPGSPPLRQKGDLRHALRAGANKVVKDSLSKAPDIEIQKDGRQWAAIRQKRR